MNPRSLPRRRVRKHAHEIARARQLRYAQINELGEPTKHGSCDLFQEVCVQIPAVSASARHSGLAACGTYSNRDYRTAEQSPEAKQKTPVTVHQMHKASSTDAQQIECRESRERIGCNRRQEIPAKFPAHKKSRRMGLSQHTTTQFTCTMTCCAPKHAYAWHCRCGAQQVRFNEEARSTHSNVRSDSIPEPMHERTEYEMLIRERRSA